MGIDAECDSNTSYACTSSKNLCECQETNEADNVDGDDDERRLNALGYPQKLKRIFDGFCSFCLTASMMSILMGVIPLYSFGLRTGGAPVIFWSWAICGCMTLGLVLSLAEISSAYPTMGALYYWAYRLGGEDYGPFYSWMAGWSNLLGQIAGVSSGSYSGAQILSDILHLMSGSRVDPMGLMYLNILTLLMGTCSYTFSYIYPYIHIYTYTHTCGDTYTHTYTHTFSHLYSYTIHLRIPIYTCTYSHILIYSWDSQYIRRNFVNNSFMC